MTTIREIDTVVLDKQILHDELIKLFMRFNLNLENKDYTEESCIYKYRNEPIYHAKVKSLVYAVMGVIPKAQEEINQTINQIKAQAVMDFVEIMKGAYLNGFVPTDTTNLTQIFQTAKHHVKDKYGVDVEYGINSDNLKRESMEV